MFDHVGITQKDLWNTPICVCEVFPVGKSKSQSDSEVVLERS
jgi:hypothetical protein